MVAVTLLRRRRSARFSFLTLLYSRTRGLIEAHGNHVTVRDVQALRDLVHLPPAE